MTLTLNSLLAETVRRGGSDLHLTVGSPPLIRVDGSLESLEHPALSPELVRELVFAVLDESQQRRLAEELELDFSFGVDELGRFRGNAFHQRGSLAAAFRHIPSEIRSIRELGLPAVVEQICERPRGLVLVTGPTGSGKSTTLAAMIDKVNRRMQGHIVTVEDPIEYLHRNRGCIVNQREVGLDTRGFHHALRSALRQDPDVVLVGEMRDLETIGATLRIAETGHLTFATLHTNSAALTINRIIDVFPPHQQRQVRTQLSFVLEGIVCQSLLPRIDGGRALAVEVLVPNSAIRNLIRDDKVHQIYGTMQAGQARHEMQTLNQSLAALYFLRELDLQVALAHSSHPDELQEMIDRGPSSLGRRFLEAEAVGGSSYV